MSEDSNYIVEALSLLKGEPAAIIEQPRGRMILRDGIGEEWTVAWVKLSTAFKPHIKELRGAPLAVWLFISLSINKQGIAFPSINKIADDTGYSRNTVMDAIATLEEKGYLTVTRGERRYNLYEPEFAAIGKMNEPSNESKNCTSQKNEPNESSFSADESSTVDLNKSNKSLTRNSFQPKTIEEAIYAGVPVPEEIAHETQNRDVAPKMFEAALGFSKPLPWWSNKEWTAFSEWVCDRYKESTLSFGEYNIWRNTPYTKGGMSNNRIRGFVREFYDSWDMFMMANKKTDEAQGEYRPNIGV